MTNVRLSKRLNCIAKMVDKGSVIADIGCDHALLDIYLSKEKIIKKAIACDITPGALAQAKKNISLNVISNIDTRLGDGLVPISLDDKVDTIIMSGLGDHKIINVLQGGLDKLKSVNCIIIQANTGIQKIRKFLISIGYLILEEKLVKEKNIIYVVIKFGKGRASYSKKELVFGPILLANKDELFIELVNNYINKNINIIHKLPNKKIFKKFLLRRKNKLLKKEIQDIN